MTRFRVPFLLRRLGSGPGARIFDHLAPWVGSTDVDRRQVTLEHTVASVRVGRQIVRRSLDGQDRGRTDIAAVLTDELIANAVTHGEPPIVLTLEINRGVLFVAVTDAAPDLPTVRRPSSDAESGRGMQLVDVLSDAWGVERLSPGKRVWFELGTPG